MGDETGSPYKVESFTLKSFMLLRGEIVSISKIARP